jgi:heme exporter protein A
MALFSALAPVTVAAQDLACVRGGRIVFAGLNIRLPPGTLTALIGPNGAGKSSLLRILAGLLRPADGGLRIEGDYELGGAYAHYVGHADALKPADTLEESLRFWAAFGGRRAAGSIVADAAEMTGLGRLLGLPVYALSAGQRRRAGLARLLLAPRALWLLDEPGSALDRAGECLLGDLMRRHLAQGGTIVAATHAALPLEPNQTVELPATV